MKLLRHVAICSTLIAGVGCSPTDDSPDIESESGVIVQRLRSAPDDGESSTFVAMDFVATDARGNALPCEAAGLDVDVEVSFDGGSSFTSIDDASVVTNCGAPAYDVALVLDNSGSQKAVLDKTREGARSFAQAVTSAGGRVSVTRVSTFSEVLEPLSSDLNAVESAIDSMFVNKGWTALYDGMRMGNETLGAELGTSPESYADLGAFCNQGRGFAMVAFTNGEENNSSQQELAGADDDGMDTTINDVLGMRVNSVPTPIHTIGLGKRVDQAALSSISNQTGGRHITVSDQDAIPSAFDLIADYAGATTQVCATATRYGCGQATFRVNYDWTDDQGNAHTGSLSYEANVPCPPAPPTGRAVTMLLTMSDPGIDAATATALSNQALSWASPMANANVLFVRDDNHHNEDKDDVQYIKGLIDSANAGWTTTYMDEPANGLTSADVASYDVIWFSNPGWPLDDPLTFQTLQGALANGKGVVMTGDDMSWSMGRAFPMSSLTKLNHRNNGTKTCGVTTDNNRGESYRVTFGSDSHPIISGLEGTSFTYGNDIDHAEAVGEGESVLATATLDSDPNCQLSTPVVVAWEP